MWSTLSFQTSDGLGLSYREYGGPPGASLPPALCLPGLTRNARDFEALASALAATRRVLSPDLRGRGRSAYDPNPASYHPGTYVRDVLELLDHARAPRVVAIGTSLGGLLTMLLAGARPGLLAAAVLNDIGPLVDPAGLARIRSYVGKGSALRSWEDAADACRATQGAAFPDFGAADWLAFARRTCVEKNGSLRFDYDPRIAEPFAGSGATPAAADPWALWAPLARIPTLVIRGALSDILSAETLAEMQRRKPDLEAIRLENRGHAPTLDEPEARAAIHEFLKRV